MDGCGLLGRALRPGTMMLIATAMLHAGQGVAAPEILTCNVEEDRLVVTIDAGPYDVIDTATGQRLEMDQCDDLKIPGRPLLPMRRFLLALPPGARATAVEVLDTSTSALPGTFNITPSPPILLLPDMPDWEAAMQRLDAEWQAEYDAAYRSNHPIPADIAWLTGRGSYRKYSYAAVAFCPFTYHPLSGQLEYHAEIRIAVRFVPAAPGGSEADLLTQVLQDRVGSERAASLFANASQLAQLYPAPDPPAAPRLDTNDYVIITVGGCQSAVTASTFPIWKADQGFQVRTVLTTDPEIAGQPGGDLAERIRNFLRSYYAVWGIQYVLCVGDYATVPMRICYPDPDFHVYDPSNPGLVAPGTPTDYYYADLSLPDDISWDSDGDGYHGEYGEDDPDFLAEVAVGRIPVNDATRITYALNKLTDFEQDNGDWKHNVLHAGSILFFANQNHSGYPFVDGATCLDSLETGLMTGLEITHFTEREGLVTSGFDWPPISEGNFTTSWRDGAHAIVNWSGHGWSDRASRTVWVWDDGDGIPEQSNGEMQGYPFIRITSTGLDDDHPSVVFAISCNVGYPDPNPYGNLGIDLLTRPGWGASAGMVNSARPAAISGDWKNDPGGTEQICYDFNRHLIVERARVGDALYNGKFDAHVNHGWQRIYEYMNLYNFNLFGDPALAVVPSTTGLTDINLSERASLRLLPLTPNPFASNSAIRFILPVAGPARVVVHDVGGRHVATLADGRFDAGEFAVTWDGGRDGGETVGSGLYLVTLIAGGEHVSRKLVYLK